VPKDAGFLRRSSGSTELLLNRFGNGMEPTSETHQGQRGPLAQKSECTGATYTCQTIKAPERLAKWGRPCTP